MQEKEPLQLGKRMHLINGFDLRVPERTGTYVIEEEKLTVVERVQVLLFCFSLEQVHYVIVTIFI